MSKIFLNIINLFLIRKKSLIIIIVASLLIAAIEYIFVFYGIIDFGQKLETLEQKYFINVLIFYGIKSFLTIVLVRYRSFASEKMIQAIELKMINTSPYNQLSWFDSSQIDNLKNLLINEINNIRNYTIGNFAILVTEILIISAFGIGILFSVSNLEFLISLFFLSIVCGITILIISKIVKTLGLKRSHFQNKYFKQTFQFFHNLKQYGSEQIFNKLVHYRTKLTNSWASAAAFSAAITNYVELVVCSSLLIIILIFPENNNLSNIPAEVLIGISYMTFRLYPSFNRFSRGIPKLNFSQPDVERVLERVNGKINSSPIDITIRNDKIKIIPNTKILNEFFWLDTIKEKIEIDKTGITLLVGDNGSGKTSFLELFYLTTFFQSELESNNLSFLKQTNTLQKDRIDKILGLNRCASKTMINLIKSFINEMFEEGLNTLKREIEVDELSVGQQQKLAFIRTIISGSTIIVLDEPFASQDTKSCNFMERLILEASKSSAILIVSHSNFKIIQNYSQLNISEIFTAK